MKLELPILPFLHANPDDIPAGKVDRDERAAKRLRQFREKVEKHHHCKYWAGAEDLGGKVSRAMVQIFKSTPRVGWVRADQVPSTKTLMDLEKLRRRSEELQAEVNRLQKTSPPHIDGLARGGDLVPFSFSYYLYTEPAPTNPSKNTERRRRKVIEPLSLSWDAVFVTIGPTMFGGEGSWSVGHALEQRLETIKQSDSEFMRSEGHGVDVAEPDVLAILTQFASLGLVEVSEKAERGRTETQWRLTAHGKDQLLRIAAILRPTGPGIRQKKASVQPRR